MNHDQSEIDMFQGVSGVISEECPLALTLKKAQSEGTSFTPQRSAEKIFGFLIRDDELHKSAHGKLYVIDEDKVLGRDS